MSVTKKQKSLINDYDQIYFNLTTAWPSEAADIGYYASWEKAKGYTAEEMLKLRKKTQHQNGPSVSNCRVELQVADACNRCSNGQLSFVCDGS